MARTPTDFFTSQRQQVLEDLMGELPFNEKGFLHLIGGYSAKRLWPQLSYDAINNPDSGRDMSRPRSGDNGHAAFKEAVSPLIDPEDIGFRGCFLPEEAGGAGISIPSYMMSLEMIAQGNASMALSLLIDGSVLNSIWGLGDDKQKERYVVNALRNKKMTSFALTEPNHGSDAGSLETKALVKENNYVLSGQKIWITNGGWADYYFVVVRTHPDKSRGPNGLSIIMVHKDEISDMRQIDKFTVPGSYTAELFFNEKAIPFEDSGVRRMVGQRDSGFASAKDLLTGGRVTVAAYGLGIATEAFEMALDYAKERPSGGKVLIEHQGMGMPLADLATELDAARYLTYVAAKRMQQGSMYYAEASKAKLFATELAARAAEFNRRIYASYGLSREYRCMQLVHDAGVGITGEGTSEIQRILIASNLKKV